MRPTVAKLRARALPESIRLLNMVRRFSIAATSGVLWILEGMVDDEGNVETRKAEAFPGVGFYSRPRAGSRAEAVVAKVGSESGHPVIVATRDLDLLKAAELGGAFGEDEAAMFNTEARVYVKADGTVEVRTHQGVAVALAKADHKHSLSGVTYGGDNAVGTMGASDSNTSKLRGE